MVCGAIAIVAAAAVSVGVAGCGSSESSTVPTAQWADNLCSALTTWKGSVTQAATSLTQGGVTKQSLEGALDRAKSSTETLADDLEGLGRPDTSVGKQAKSEVDDLATQLDDDVSTIEDAVDSASGVQGIVSAASVVTDTLTTMGRQVQATLTNLQDLAGQGTNEIKSAFQQSSSCMSLTSGS
jgi:hypothetical protein